MGLAYDSFIRNFTIACHIGQGATWLEQQAGPIGELSGLENWPYIRGLPGLPELARVPTRLLSLHQIAGNSQMWIMIMFAACLLYSSRILFEFCRQDSEYLNVD
jgi:hypothetical protein